MNQDVKGSNTPDQSQLLVLDLQRMYKSLYHDFNDLLLKINLSANYIESLPAEMTQLRQLRILHLHFNLIKSDNFSNLFSQGSLNYLTIFNNPIASQMGIRRTFISRITTLWALDFNVIVDEERHEYIFLKEDSKYRMLSNITKIQWPIVLEDNLSPNQKFWIELHIIRTSFEQASFVLTIQKHFRGYYSRKIFRHKVQPIQEVDTTIIDIVNHWKQFTINKREIRQILMSQCRPQFIKLLGMYRAYKKKKVDEYMNKNASRIIFKAIKRNSDNFQNFYSHVQKLGGQKFYFSKYQIDLFLQLLEQTQLLIHKNMYFKNRRLIDGIIEFIKINSFSNIVEANTTRYLHLSPIQAIRITDQDRKFKFQNIMLLLHQPASSLKVIYNFKRAQAISRKQEINQRQNQNQFFNQITLINKAQLSLLDEEKEQKELFDLEITLQGQENYKFLVRHKNLIKVKHLKNFKPSDKNRQSSGLTAKESIKFQETKTKIDQFQQSEYLQLMVTYIPYKTLLQQLLKVIYIHNKNAQNDPNLEQFHLYFDYQVTQINAVIKIQKAFRGFLDVKRNGCDLNEIMRQINRQRAVMLIQRWLRRLKENHRHQFFKEIAFRASLINSNNLYLSKEIYMKLQDISKSNQYNLKFLEQLHNIYVDPIQRIVRLQLKEVTFQTVESRSSLRGESYKEITNQILDQCSPYKQTNVIPQWLIKQICNVPKIQGEVDFRGLQHVDSDHLDKQVTYKDLMKHYSKTLSMINATLKSVDEQTKKRGDILHVIHTGSSCQWTIIDRKQYISLNYESIQEARYRMISLALHSYRFSRNGCFLWMFGDEILENLKMYPSRTKKILNDYSLTLKKIYNIEILQLDTPLEFKIDLKPSVFLFTAYSSYLFSLSLNRRHLPVQLYAQKSDSNQIKKVEGQLYYFIENYRNRQIQEDHDLNLKITQNQEVQNCDEVRWYQSSPQNLMDQVFNTPLSTDYFTSMSQYSQKFSVLQLDRMSQLPQIQTQDPQLNKNRSKLFVSKSKCSKIFDSPRQDYANSQRLQIDVKGDNQLLDNTSGSLMPQTLDNSTQNILIQDFQLPILKTLQQRIERQLLKEIRDTEKIIHLDKIKEQNQLDKIFAAKQIELNKKLIKERNIQVVNQVQTERRNNDSNDESYFLSKFETSANFILKQEKTFRSRRQKAIKMSNNSMHVQNSGYKQRIKDQSTQISHLPKMKQSNEGESDNQALSKDLVREQISRRIFNNKSTHQSYNCSFELNSQIQEQAIIQNKEIPQIEIDEKFLAYLPKSSRSVMFNRMQGGYKHKYRHSVFPEEFYAIGSDKNILLFDK